MHRSVVEMEVVAAFAVSVVSVSLAFSVALSVSLSVPVSALVLVVLSRAEPNVFEAATLRRSPMACDASASAS